MSAKFQNSNFTHYSKIGRLEFDFQRFFAKSRDFDGGPKTKRGLRINPLGIELYSVNTEFLLDIKFLSLKI